MCSGKFKVLIVISEIVITNNYFFIVIKLFKQNFYFCKEISLILGMYYCGIQLYATIMPLKIALNQFLWVFLILFFWFYSFYILKFIEL